jgi:hypothetical protein
MSQEEAEELRMSLRAVSQNLDALEAGGLMWHEVSPPISFQCFRAFCPSAES